MKQQQFVTEVLAAEKQLYGIARSMLKREVDCEDAIQNTLLRAYANLKTLRNDKFFRTWLTRILINECYRILKKERHLVPYEEAENKSTEWENEYSEVYEALMTLKEPYRLAFVLHYIEGYSVKETARILKISETNAKQRLLRARSQLKEILKGEMEGAKYLR
ncbi:sigma-70 family RNA polymerase sigma factor [Parablautia intestinalis]|jgi:RNA polymerase sigma-70 factor (ECF subfamily)|uniref:Sigma-70 family RNA polymerase sigma factor n=1 Tax=Parablautia intestinalis TaxID=2320100 RepID=A0A3A9AE03_9FIRM|nr:sigma-70 family RNA polymerase sigma factor [Parablautia intestinalis]MCI8614209.1 sigma-70 family RNA polymerase sigma factor [Lachnospiraceae bacterium]MDE7047470.1 sigma-70 family RNA polymerase sigma factor [Lachnospiraceae bacterium]RKI89488.1 sigma-70 family RNA polymerase sigma factor [Parablautia intestinalis]